MSSSSHLSLLCALWALHTLQAAYAKGGGGGGGGGGSGGGGFSGGGYSTSGGSSKGSGEWRSCGDGKFSCGAEVAIGFAAAAGVLVLCCACCKLLPDERSRAQNVPAHAPYPVTQSGRTAVQRAEAGWSTYVGYSAVQPYEYEGTRATVNHRVMPPMLTAPAPGRTSPMGSGKIRCESAQQTPASRLNAARRKGMHLGMCGTLQIV